MSAIRTNHQLVSAPNCTPLDFKAASKHPNADVYGILFLDWDQTIGIIKKNESSLIDKEKTTEIIKLALVNKFHIIIVTARPLVYEDIDNIDDIVCLLKSIDNTIKWHSYIHSVQNEDEFLDKSIIAVRKRKKIINIIENDYPHLIALRKERCLYADDTLEIVEEVARYIPAIHATSSKLYFDALKAHIDVDPSAKERLQKLEAERLEQEKIRKQLEAKRAQDEKNKVNELSQTLKTHLLTCLNNLYPKRNDSKPQPSSLPTGIATINKWFLNPPENMLEQIFNLARERKKKTYLEWSICPFFWERDPLVAKFYSILSKVDSLTSNKLQTACQELNDFSNEIKRVQNKRAGFENLLMKF